MRTDSTTHQALVQLAHAVKLIEAATATLAQADLSAGHAAYFAWLTEQTAQRVTRAEIHAADAVRRTAAHQLDEPSFQAIIDAGLDPKPVDLKQTEGQYCVGRSYYKEPAAMLGEWLNLGFNPANTRLVQADSLIAQVSDTGQRLEPRYRQLGEEFQRANTQPALLLSAATQLRKAEATLAQAPDAQQARDELESDAMALIRHEPATALKHIKGMINQTLGEDRPLAALLAEVGLYRSGKRRGLVHYRLSILPQDAELIESLCAQIDNPATIAGNREELKNLVYGQYLASNATEEAPHSTASSAQPEWGDAQDMPQWAQPHDDMQTATAEPSIAPSVTMEEPVGVCEPATAEAAPATGHCHPPNSADTAQDATASATAREDKTRAAALRPNHAGTSQPREEHNETPTQLPASSAAKSLRGTVPAPADSQTKDLPESNAQDLINHAMPAEISLPFEELRPEFRHLMALLSTLRASGGNEGKQTGVVQPQITVIIDYFKMMTLGKNFAVTENGLPLAAGAARTMLCNAGIMPVIFGGKSKILDIAQESRFFPKYMRKALQAKYRGCAYPGCTMPASRCEVDHIKPWEEGGATSVDNGCLFCPMHHHARHCGLFTVIVNEEGPPMVLLPKNLDPHQRPRLNTYWYSPSEAIEIARNATVA